MSDSALTVSSWVIVALGVGSLGLALLAPLDRPTGLRPLHWVAMALTLSLSLAAAWLSGAWTLTAGVGLLGMALIALGVRSRGVSGGPAQPPL